MNKERRLEIRKRISALEILKNEIEYLQEQEEEAFSNMPESIQSSEQGEISEAAASHLEEAVEALDSAISELEAAIG